MSDAGQQAFVVMEQGGEWPAWLGRIESCSDSTLTLVQQEDEQHGDFAQRVAERVALLGEQGVHIDLAVVACSERADEGIQAERRAIASAVVNYMASLGKGGRVLLTESQRKSGGTRRAISELAADLSHRWEDAGVHISVRFGQPSRPPQGAMLDFQDYTRSAAS